MEGLEAIISMVGKLGGASFATLLAVILWGSWKNVWVWSRDVDKLAEHYEALLSGARDDIPGTSPASSIGLATGFEIGPRVNCGP